MEENKNDKEHVLWIGLESYDERYSSIFYGRDLEIEQLANAIYNNISTVVYGPSGTGKTSIIRAGVFPKARAKRYLPVYVRLNHGSKAENARTYTQQIIDVIQETLYAGEIDCEQVLPYVAGDRCQSLWEFFRCNEFWSADNYPVTPLLVLDQFEEIFTRGKNNRIQPDFFEQLSDLLDNKYPEYIRRYLSSRDNTHIVYPDKINFRCLISLREDFLPRLEEHAESIPSLKRNRFSLQCLNERQALDIIMKPQSGLVSEEVAIQIIEKVTNKRYRVDFKLHNESEIEVEPSLLSLFCRELDKKRTEKGMCEITRDLISEFGDNIIKDFYISTIEKLSPDKVKYLEDRLLTDDGFRDAVALGNAYKAGLTDDEIEFLTKNRLVRIDEWDGAKRIEFTHDVLCKVAMTHRDEREERKRREDLERQQEEEKRRIIAEEQAKRNELKRQAFLERQRIKRRNRRWLAALSLMIVMLVFGVTGYYLATTYEVVSYYESFTQRWGWPEGVGEKLSSAERAKTPLYYRLSHKGLLNKYDTEVQVCSSNPRLPLSGRLPNPYVGVDELNDTVAKSFVDKLNHVRTIHFDGDRRTINREVYLDEEGEPLFTVNYLHVDDGNGAVRMFVDPRGLSMPLKGGNNMLDRVKLSWDGDGRLKSMRFFNEKDVCVPGADGIFGYRIIYDGDTMITYILDEFGRPVQNAYNATLTRTAPSGRLTIYAKGMSANDSLPKETNGPLGYSRIFDTGDKQEFFVLGDNLPVAKKTVEHDKRGNITSVTIQGLISPGIPAKAKYAYDDTTGYLILEEYFDGEDRPFAQYPYSVYRRECRYSDGLLTSEVHTAVNGSIPYSYTLYNQNNCTVQTWIDKNDSIEHITRIDSLRADGGKSVAYYTVGNKPINLAKYEGGDSIKYHLKIFVEKDTVIDTRYYSVNNDGAVVPLGTSDDDQDNYFRRLERYDVNHHLLSQQRFNAQGEIMVSNMYIVQDGQTVGRAAMGIDGTPVRCPDWEPEGFGYYTLYYTKDRNNVFTHVMPVNELGEPSVLYDSYDNEYYDIVPINYKDLNVKKSDGRTVPIKSDYFQNEFVKTQGISDLSIAFLHMLSRESDLYEAGLRDGDRILSLGSWTFDKPARNLEREWIKLTGGASVKIKVLRTDGIVWDVIERDIRVKANNPLAHYHILKLTESEKHDFLNAINGRL